VNIVELEAIKTLVRAGFVVTAVGGGGIPVVRDAGGDLHGVEAVIDKDLASSLLATALKADQFVISTSVDRVYLDYGTPSARPIDRLTLDEARRYLAEGQFGEGSMAPKIRSIIQYLGAGGKRGVITNPANLEQAVADAAGTVITS
jgi:carbamate kinase